MNRPTPDDSTASAPVKEDDDLFSQGWLDRHIDAVVAKNANAPEPFRSMLNGPYYHSDGTVRSTKRKSPNE